MGMVQINGRPPNLSMFSQAFRSIMGALEFFDYDVGRLAGAAHEHNVFLNPDELTRVANFLADLSEATKVVRGTPK
jgi:hypothetical protein